MSKTKTTILIIGIILFVVGVIVCFCAAAAMGFDFGKLNTSKYVTNKHILREDFNKISVDTKTADVVFALSQDGVGRVVCYEKENLIHTVEIKDGTLVIKLKDTRKWYEYISIVSKSTTVAVQLPKEQYDMIKAEANTGVIHLEKGLYFDKAELDTNTGDITVLSDCKTLDAATDTGRIHINSAKIDYLNLETDTGKVNIKDVNAKSLSIEVDTGDVDLENVIAEEKMIIEGSTADIDLDMCDSADISIKTSTGDVFGTLLTPKIFSHKTSTGDVDLPESEAGGKCRIVTSTGDIEMRIAK